MSRGCRGRGRRDVHGEIGKGVEIVVGQDSALGNDGV